MSKQELWELGVAITQLRKVLRDFALEYDATLADVLEVEVN